MGAWGMAAFDNDDASDRVWQLEESTDLELLNRTLASVLGASEYLEAPQCSEALAAAEVVAALHGQPAPNLPDEVRSWVAKRDIRPGVELVDAALGAVTKIAASSELKELWEESEDFAEWEAGVLELKQRLAT